MEFEKAPYLKPLIASGGMLSYTLFFGALDFTIVSCEIVWFKVQTIIMYALLQLIIVSTALILFGLLLRGKARLIYSTFLFGLAIALYVQGNFLNQELSVLNGSTEIFSKSVVIINLLIWTTIVITPFVLCRFIKVWPKVMMYVILILWLTQTSTLAFEVMSCNNSTVKPMLTDKDITEIGNENIIVLIIDMVDKQYVEKILQNDTSYFDYLDGFTYFENCSGLFSATNSTIHYLLTGEEYHREKPSSVYSKEAFSGDIYLKQLRNQYEIDLYTSSTYINVKDDELISNLIETDVKSSSPYELVRAWYKVILHRYFPIILKNKVELNSKDYDIIQREYSVDGISSYSMTNDKQIEFYQAICEKGLTKTEKKLYKFIHLLGAHIPFSLTEDSTCDVSGNSTYLETTKGCFNIVKSYVQLLKDEGVYDNSTIIVMSDHGAYNYNVTNPFLFVKPAGSTGEFKRSAVPVSWRDFIPSIMTAAGMNENDKYGKAFWNIEDNEARDRQFYFYFQENQPIYGISPLDQIEFDVPDFSSNPQYFDATGNVYTSSKGVVPLSSYKKIAMGELVDFSNISERSYFDYGICTEPDTHAFSWGYSSQMSCEITNWNGQAAQCYIGAKSCTGTAQNVIVKSGDTVLFDGAVITDGISFSIPASCIWLQSICRYCENGKTDCYAENAFNEVSDACDLYPLEIGENLCSEIDCPADLAVVSEKVRALSEQTVYMCFSTDMIHSGHIAIIQKARRLGKLIIGVLSDEAIVSYKRFPLLPYAERKAMFESINGVFEVVEQRTLSYRENILKFRPAFVVHGDDWVNGFQRPIRDEVVSVLSEYGGKLIEPPYSNDPKYKALENRARAKLSLPDLRRSRLKKVLSMKSLVTAMEAHSGITGLIVEKTAVHMNGETHQFDAIWISSLCDSTAKGKPDIELVDMTSRFRTIDDIVEVTTKPIIFDGDTGGLAEHFAYTVRSLERMGVSMVIIEDKTGLKKNSLFGNDVPQTQDSIESFCEKISAGKQAQKTNDFMICARIESLILDKGLADALERAFAFIDAGADAIMIHSRKTEPDEIFEFADCFRRKNSTTPIVVVPTCFNAVTEEEFKSHGINVVIYANQFTRSGFPAMKKTAESILVHHRAKEADEQYCMPIKEIITLIPEQL